MAAKKLHTPVFDHLDNLSNDELDHYMGVWKDEYEKLRKHLDIADQKYNALIKEYHNRTRSKKYWGGE